MPRAGVPNNPSGTNGFDGFKVEPPYGQIQRTNRLAAASPLAGGKIAAGNLNAAKKDQRLAKRPKPSPPPPGGGYVQPPVEVPAEGPAPLPPGAGGVIPPPGGIVGAPTGAPPWTVPYPPGTIQNHIAAQILAALAERYGTRHPILRLYA